MIFHPNPMFQERPGFWHDVKLRTVRVEPRLLNRTNYRQRWIVLHKKGTAYEVISSHISEYAAVTAAQTLANRIYMKTEAYKRERRQRSKKGR